MGYKTVWKSRLWLFLLMMLLPLPTTQDPELPSNLNLGNLPDTSFSCEGKVVGGYYADIETKCQMFHVCTLGSKGETQDIKFLCLQGTVFDQETRVCERSEEVVCQDSTQYYDLNKQLYQEPNRAHIEFPESGADSAGQASVASVLLKLDSTDSPTSVGRYSAASSTDSPTSLRRYPSGAASAESPPTAGRYPAADYTDDFSVRFAETGRSTVTRAEVPLFSPRRTEPRHSSSPPPPSENVKPFSRFRQTRWFTASSTTAPSIPSLPPSATARVPLIPRSSDRSGPRLVVTNGKPFEPKLNNPIPAPAKRKTESFPSLTLPDTNFTCESKVSGGHYADPETSCKMFHICVMGPDGTITDYKLLCGSTTVFDQKTRTCQETEKVDCASSAKNYYVNDHLTVPTVATTPTPRYDYDSSDLEVRHSEYSDYYDYYFDYPEYKDFTETSTDSRVVQHSTTKSVTSSSSLPAAS